MTGTQFAVRKSWRANDDSASLTTTAAGNSAGSLIQYPGQSRDCPRDQELTFDDKPPLIATVKTWMHPEDELRIEAYVNGKQVWGMVSTRMKDGKSTIVEWNDKKCTKPYSAGGWEEGRSCHLRDNVPGRCIPDPGEREVVEIQSSDTCQQSSRS